MSEESSRAAWGAATPPGTQEEAHSLERFSPPLIPGTYTVKAQALRINGITTFTLDDYVLVVNVVN